MSEPEIQRQVRQQRADIHALYELVGQVDQKVDVMGLRVERVDQRIDALDVRVVRIEEKVDALDVRVVRIEEKVDALDVKLDRRFVAISGQLSDVLRQLGGR